jgi:hypothetical protein
MVRLPRLLEEFYRSSGLVECFEFYLAPPGAGHPRWYIAHFVPLTSRDVAEWLKVTGVPGIPIALDGDKGTYYLPFEALRQSGSPPVLFRAPGLGRQDTEVAPSLEDFIGFQRVEAPDEAEGR